MGLKGYRLWVMGQLDSNVQHPTEVLWQRRQRRSRDGTRRRHRGVALQVAFERQTLKPAFPLDRL
jgi:hypothetical protein